MIDRETGEIVPVFLRTPYNYDMDSVSRETGLECCDATRTQQQFAEEVNINTIVERFGLTGQLPEEPVNVPQSVDYMEGVYDFQSAMNMVRAAQESFMQLPADVRDEFANDFQRLMKFVEDPANLERARKLGIAVPAPVPAPVPEPMPVRIISDDPKTS